MKSLLKKILKAISGFNVFNYKTKEDYLKKINFKSDPNEAIKGDWEKVNDCLDKTIEQYEKESDETI